MHGKTLFTEADFCMIFDKPIEIARKLFMNQEAEERTSMRSAGTIPRGMSISDKTRDEVHHVLVKAIIRKSYDDIFEEARK